MPLLMGIPPELNAGVTDGLFARYGCILKRVDTGRIVAHLKEVGEAAGWLSRVPLGPIAAGASLAFEVVQAFQARGVRPTLAAMQQTLASLPPQLARMEGTLERLNLICGIGSVAAVAGLGVSVAGFGIVLRRLARLEQNLNGAMDRLRAGVKRLRLDLDMLRMAELGAAWEQLAGARHTALPGRSAELLKDADRTFQRYRNHYHHLIVGLRPLERGEQELGLPQTRELYARFVACCQAELEANFLLGDIGQWHYRHGVIMGQAREVCEFDARETLHARADATPHLHGNQMEQLRVQVAFTHDFCRENLARLETADAEVRFLGCQGLSSKEYLRELGAANGCIHLVQHAG